MPTYDYVCGACGHALEIFHSISEAPKRKCPKCGKSKLERQIGAGAGFLFKGSGFYKTDYRSSDYQAAAKKDSADGAAASSTSETKSDASAPAQGGADKPDKSKSSSETKATSKPAADAKPKKKSKD
jgi:putative FmdB family regulatory protein